jgi:hypothetical protein
VNEVETRHKLYNTIATKLTQKTNMYNTTK